ncbi:MAG: hypothetical protein ABFR05_07790 [Bacteroidota bacterium]
MKIVVLIMAFFMIANLSFSQTVTQEEIEVIQSMFGTEKRDIIRENVNLTNTDANAFWNLYSEYEEERVETANEKIKLLQRYNTLKGDLSEVQVEEMMNKAIIIRSTSNNIIIKYYKRIKKATNPLVAAQFYQIEHYISDGISFTVLDNIDFIQDK